MMQKCPTEIVSPVEGIRLGSVITLPDGQKAIEVKGGIKKKRFDSVPVSQILRTAYGEDGQYSVLKIKGKNVMLIQVDKPPPEAANL